jgi:hypothetical protein
VEKVAQNPPFPQVYERWNVFFQQIPFKILIAFEAKRKQQTPF